MSSTELKELFISRIQVIDDDQILSGLLRIFEAELKNAEQYKLNKYQRESIAIAEQQILNGEVYTEEEADKLTDEWLNGQCGLNGCLNEKIEISDYRNTRNKVKE